MQVLQPLSRAPCLASHYSLLLDCEEMASLPIRSYSDVPEQRAQGLSPHSSTSTPSTERLVSSDRTSKAKSRSPSIRQRTPIRHHRPSTSRIQSNARSDTLLTYASQPESQATTSQTMATSQSAFPPSVYMMPPATSSYHLQNSYYSSDGISQQQSGGQYMLAPSPYNVEPAPSTYFSLGRSGSYPLETLPSMQSADPLYQPHLSSNASSNHWPSSTAAPQLPSMSLPSSNTYSPPPASTSDVPDGIRVLASRPKPQCFDHGCNGRQFSTFSNLLRHQREKSGSASKAVCPHCGTEFTRTTARNGHLYGGKCKGRVGQGGPESEALANP
jgi:hypothetical protein